MRLIYLKPELRDLSQGARLAFVRQFRFMTQDDVASKLGLNGESKRKVMTRYEKGGRTPKKERVIELAKMFNVSPNAIKHYTFNDPIDIIYTLLWMEELIPNFKIDTSKFPNLNYGNNTLLKNFINEWNIKIAKRKNREISYEDYIEWKLTYEVNNHE